MGESPEERKRLEDLAIKSSEWYFDKCTEIEKIPYDEDSQRYNRLKQYLPKSDKSEN